MTSQSDPPQTLVTDWPLDPEDDVTVLSPETLAIDWPLDPEDDVTVRSPETLATDWPRGLCTGPSDWLVDHFCQ